MPAKTWSCCLAMFLLAGCSGEPAAVWQVEVSGCETWVAGPICTTGKENLRVWIGGDSESYELELDEEKLRVGPKLAGAGQQFEFPVPSTARQLTIRRAGSEEAFELSLMPSLQPSWLREVMELAYKGDEKAARDLLEREAKDDQARKLLVEAHFAFMMYNQRGKAAELASRSADLWRDQGQPGYAVRELLFASHMLAVDARYPESRAELEKAEAILESLSGWLVLPVRLHYLVGHQRATLAHFTGDVRSSLESLDQLSVFGRDHQLLSEEEISDRDQLTVNVLAELGRFEEAAKLLDRLRSPSLTDEQKASLDTNRGWIALLAQQAGHSDVDPEPYFKAAWSYYGRQELGDQQKFNAQLNLAAAAVLHRRLDAAQDHLERARDFEAAASAHERFLFDELEARLLLLRGQPQEALDNFRKLDRRATEHHLPAARWQALIGMAEALAALGDHQAAVDTFALAEKLESRELILIPLDKGRETFLARREGTTRQHLELLLEQHRQDQAFELVRRRRVQTLALLHRDERVAAFEGAARRAWDKAASDYRQLRQLEENGGQADFPAPGESRADPRRRERNDSLSKLLDEALFTFGLPGQALRNAETTLAKPLPGELTLAFFPRESSWLIFAMDEEKLEMAEEQVAKGTPLEEPVASALLAKVAPQIHACRKIRILSWGGLDFHAVSFEGQPLVAAKPLVYGLDVGAAAPAAAAAAGPRRVVLVADPTKLKFARKEIEAAERILARRAGYDLEDVLLGRDAKPELVRRAIEKADFFHFAGHGEFDQAGSQSRLILSGGELKAGDVFTLEKVPEQVLLSSCHVGRSARVSGVEGLGLAYAFVLAGSHQVLAATRAVNDGDTAALMRALYRHIDNTPAEIDLAASLRAAQLELGREAGKDAWKAFRVFEP
jgi:tetratricopeptide (TPR) repeat protein